MTLIPRKTLWYRIGIAAGMYLVVWYLVFSGRDRIIILWSYEWLMMFVAVRASYFFIVPFINTSVSNYRKNYYLTLPSYLKVLAFILVIVLFVRFPTRESALLINTVILWWFLFFDSRYFALGAWIMLWMTMGHLLFGDQASADYTSIILYYYLILTVIIWLFDTTIDTLISKDTDLL